MAPSASQKTPNPNHPSALTPTEQTFAFFTNHKPTQSHPSIQVIKTVPNAIGFAARENISQICVAATALPLTDQQPPSPPQPTLFKGLDGVSPERSIRRIECIHQLFKPLDTPNDLLQNTDLSTVGTPIGSPKRAKNNARQHDSLHQRIMGSPHKYKHVLVTRIPKTRVPSQGM